MNRLLFFTCIITTMFYFSIQPASRPPANQSIVAEILAEEYMNRALYAPWRESYQEKDELNNAEEKPKDCVFCLEMAQKDDSKALTLARNEHTIVTLNPYPYTQGHLLVIPRYHVKYLHELSGEARAELIEIISASILILKNVLKVEGANVGINFEQVSGASIPDHMHVHIVPRQHGDANFMQIIGNTKIICWDLYKLYLRLKPSFDTLEIKNKCAKDLS